MSKKLWVILGSVVIVLIGGLVFLFTYTYSVSGKVTDITNKLAVKGVKVAVVGHSQETDEQGDYKISGIKIYQKKAIVVVVPSQFTKQGDIQVDYKSRKIQKDFTIEPTLEEIVNRDLVAEKNGQYDYMWDLMHPDDQAYWVSKDEYKNLMTQGNKVKADMKYVVKSSAIGQNIRTLDTWKSDITGKEYEGITEVPVTYVMVDNGKEQPENVLQHYQRVDGFYHYFTSTNKDDAKKAIDLYNSLKSL